MAAHHHHLSTTTSLHTVLVIINLRLPMEPILSFGSTSQQLILIVLALFL
jgi:hypothetical protein